MDMLVYVQLKQLNKIKGKSHYQPALIASSYLLIDKNLWFIEYTIFESTQIGLFTSINL